VRTVPVRAVSQSKPLIYIYAYVYIAIGRKWTPASDGSEEAADDPVLVIREVAVLYVGPKVVEPAQPAALAASLQPYTARAYIIVWENI
jgi:hypothetical protein